MICPIHNNYNYHKRANKYYGDLKESFNIDPAVKLKHETTFHIYCDSFFHYWFALDEKGIELHDFDRVSKCNY
jgi:hypothetical protein